MTIRGLLRAGAASLVAAGIALGTGSGYARVAAADYTRYHTYDELTAALRELAKTHPNLAKLVEVAKTREGRTVWAIEIGNPSGTPLAERPALLIAANLEGDQVIGSELALFVAEALLTGYAGTPAIKARLDANVFYILPRVNPDAAELMFAALKTGRKTNASKFDNDNDGRVDEDGPEDLNKDGVISMMRVKDPLGPYMINPDDPRLMRRADAQKGERGGYAIYWEGTDDDGDGFYNEDPAGGIDVNRNFQHQYPYFQPDAGPHMASEAETRGVLEYVLGRRNVAAVLTFGESDNLIAPPTRTGAHAPASPIDLVAFANQSIAGARDVGRFQAPLAFGGRGGRGFGGGDDEGGRWRRRERRPGRRARWSDAAGDDRQHRRRRVLPRGQRQVPVSSPVSVVPPPRGFPAARSSNTRTTSSASPHSRRQAGVLPSRQAPAAAVRALVVARVEPVDPAAGAVRDRPEMPRAAPPKPQAPRRSICASCAGWMRRRSTASPRGSPSSTRRSATSKSAASGPTRRPTRRRRALPSSGSHTPSLRPTSHRSSRTCPSPPRR